MEPRQQKKRGKKKEEGKKKKRKERRSTNPPKLEGRERDTGAQDLEQGGHSILAAIAVAQVPGSQKELLRCMRGE
jgi:hypothetical protein